MRGSSSKEVGKTKHTGSTIRASVRVGLKTTNIRFSTMFFFLSFDTLKGDSRRLMLV